MKIIDISVNHNQVKIIGKVDEYSAVLEVDCFSHIAKLERYIGDTFIEIIVDLSAIDKTDHCIVTEYHERHIDRYAYTLGNDLRLSLLSGYRIALSVYDSRDR